MFGKLKTETKEGIPSNTNWLNTDALGDDRNDVLATVNNWLCCYKYCNALCAPFPRNATGFMGMKFGRRSFWCRNFFLVPSAVTSGTSISLYIHLATWLMAVSYLAMGAMPINDAGGGRTVVKLFAAICSVYPGVAVALILFSWIVVGQRGFGTEKDKILPVARMPLLQAVIFWLLFSTLVAASALVAMMHVQLASAGSLILIPDKSGTAPSADVTQKNIDNLVIGLLLAIAGLGQLFGNLVFAALHFAVDTEHSPA